MSLSAKINSVTPIRVNLGEAKLIQGEKGDRGVMWYTGTALTGTATVAGTAPAKHLDLYLNTDTSNVYQCTAPSETAATWVYLCNIKGLTGDTGATGATGNGIASAALNADYTLTLTFTDGQTYTTPSIRGVKGDTGVAGQKGQDGESPYIGLNGNWYVGETDTGTPAQGKEGSCGLLPQIIVTAQADATVTATSGGETVSGTATGGTCTLSIPTFGTWLVTVTKGSDTSSKTVIVDTVKIYEINIQFYQVYGFTINEAESNPLASVAYTDKATAFSKGSVAWDTSPLFANIKPCLFNSGEVVGYLQRNDYTKFENGTAADITSGNAGDVMVEIPKMAYYMEKSGNIITCKVLIGDVDAKTIDARYSYLPFSRNAEGDRDKIYIGAYLGFELSSKLRSLSGKSPTANKTIGAFRTAAQANGTGYQQFPFYQLTLIQILYIMKYGSLDGQTALGRGYVDGNAAATTTGSTNSRGFCFGETTGKQQMKMFGIEDFWGNLYQWIDGLYCNASWTILTTYKTFNDTGSGYLFNNASGISADTIGYMNVSQGGTQTGFNLKTAGGSCSTYYAGYASLYAGCLPAFGGFWAASSAGAFRLRVDYSASGANSNFGARLCYI